MEILLFLGLAIALGFKHSYDADHLVAVSNLLTRSKSLRRTVAMSGSWALGHMLTASGVTVLLFVFREAFLARFLGVFELVVAAMLIGIGLASLAWEFRVFHRLGLLHEHPHEHLTGEHAHPHFHLRRFGEHGAMFGIGIVHGLASNDELLVLLVAALSVATLQALLLGVAVFSLGVILGMVLFGVGLSYPIMRWGDVTVRRVTTVLTATLSIAYGLLLFAGFEGVSLIPFAIRDGAPRV